MKGHGTTSDLNVYSFKDYNSVDAYYRYRQIDYDGNYEYSPLQYVALQKSLIDKLKIYPNSTTGPITTSGAITSYALYDETGRLLIENSNTSSYFAQTELSLFLSHQTKGVYLLKTYLNEQVQVSRISKR